MNVQNIKMNYINQFVKYKNTFLIIPFRILIISSKLYRKIQEKKFI